MIALCFLIKPDGIVRGGEGTMDSCGTGNSQQMDHKKQYTCALASDTECVCMC